MSDALNTPVAWLVVGVGLLVQVGGASASEALARQRGCLDCHAVDRKVVGPAFKDIAAKYRGDPGAEARLVEKLKKGGDGVWGAIFMPPMSTVPESERRILVKWILSTK